MCLVLLNCANQLACCLQAASAAPSGSRQAWLARGQAQCARGQAQCINSAAMRLPACECMKVQQDTTGYHPVQAAPALLLQANMR